MEAILGKALTWIADYLWSKVEARLDTYFEVRNEKAATGKEAGALYDELENAQSDAERSAILKKISAFADLNKLRSRAKL